MHFPIILEHSYKILHPRRIIIFLVKHIDLLMPLDDEGILKMLLGLRAVAFDNLPIAVKVTLRIKSCACKS